jgi:hypothetical protein
VMASVSRRTTVSARLCGSSGANTTDRALARPVPMALILPYGR